MIPAYLRQSDRVVNIILILSIFLTVGTTISSGQSFSVEESKYINDWNTQPNLLSVDYIPMNCDEMMDECKIKRDVYARLVYHADNSDLKGSAFWNLRLNVKLTDENQNELAKSLEVDFHQASGNYEAVFFFENFDGNMAQLEIMSMVWSSDNWLSQSILDPQDLSIPEDIELFLVMEVERYDYLDPDMNISGITSSYTDNSLSVSWSDMPGATHYELQWIFDDTHNDLNADIQNGPSIEVSTNSYDLSVHYPEGDLNYRIRPIGRFLNDDTFNSYQIKRGEWSTVQTYTLNIGDSWHLDMNWQYQTSFAEEGKSKKVMSFYDDALKSRQTLTNLSSTGKSLVASSYYDFEGRPSISVLPSPIQGNSLSFIEDFNTVNGSDLSAKDFDNESFGLPLDITSGSSRYYSSENNDGFYHDLIPDAGQYPYSQTKYKRDGTGRIEMQSGVGAQYKLGEDKITQYFYDVPSSSQLENLFGSQVGNPKYYKRNLVMDPNGQMSVSYLDPAGRVIATALSGVNPENTISLESNENDEVLIEKDLTEYDQNEGGKIITVTTVLNEMVGNIIEIDYNLSPKILEYNGVSILCEYQVEIIVTDPCGVTVEIEGQDHYPFYATGSSMSHSESIETEYIGEYVIYKSLCPVPIPPAKWEEILEQEGKLPSEQDIQTIVGEVDYGPCELSDCDHDEAVSYCETYMDENYPELVDTDDEYQEYYKECLLENDCFENLIIEYVNTDCQSIWAQMRDHILPGGCLYPPNNVMFWGDKLDELAESLIFPFDHEEID